MPIPAIQGKDFNLFQKITVNNVAFPNTAQVIINFRGQSGFSLVNEGATIVEYSFNGITVHGDLTPLTPSEAMIFDNRRISAIWFRSPDINIVRVEAWGGI